MTITGTVERIAAYNDERQSRGIQVDKTWYNRKGTSDECNAFFKKIEKGRQVTAEVDEDRYIKSMGLIELSPIVDGVEISDYKPPTDLYALEKAKYTAINIASRIENIDFENMMKMADRIYEWLTQDK